MFSVLKVEGGACYGNKWIDKCGGKTQRHKNTNQMMAVDVMQKVGGRKRYA